MVKKKRKEKEKETLNEALGISKKRMKEMGDIILKSTEDRPKRSELIEFIFSNPEFTEMERMYLCFDYGYESAKVDLLGNSIFAIEIKGEK